MQSTLTPQDTDPHDAFVIEPDVVLAARKASPDPVQELLSHLAQKAAQEAQTSPEVSVVPEASAAALTPAVDTTFRAAAIDTTDRPAAPDDRPGIGWWVKRAFVAFMFALCSAFAAAAWTHHGAAARQLISSWLPPFVLAASPVTDKPVTDKAPAAEQPELSTGSSSRRGRSDAGATGISGPGSGSTLERRRTGGGRGHARDGQCDAGNSTESMARDLKTMGQQIEQLKASVEQLKASQAQMSRDMARNPEPSPRPRTSALPPRPWRRFPPRPIPAPPRKPRTAYLPPPTYAVPPAPPPPPLPQPVVSQPAPLPEATDQSYDGPVVRPPMPLR